MRVTRRKFTTAAASLLVFGPVGCASVSDKQPGDKLSIMDRMPWAKKSDGVPKPYPNPVKIAATWTPDSLVQMGRTPTRGFGGRVFFYDEKSRPVPVEGTLIVHGFDDHADSPENTVKRFEFTPEQFTRHFSQTDLGASYSIWIPWDAVGGDQRRISLVASFKTPEGKLVQGIPATIVLPGRGSAESASDPTANYSPAYREYRDAQESLTPRSSGLTTTTIQRRRLPTGSTQPSAPGIKIPHLSGENTMIATQTTTPSVDIKMADKAGRSTILPASAQMPISER